MIPQPSQRKSELPALLRRREGGIAIPKLPVWSDHRAWLTSCAVHTLLLVALAMFWQPQTRGTGDRIDRPAGIAVFHEVAGNEEYFLSGGSAANASATPSPAASSASQMANDSGPPISVSDLMAELVGATGEASASASSDAGLGQGLSGLGTGTTGTGNRGGKTTTSFMGVRGTGASFVYVLDRSASMSESGGAPMVFAKRELLKSIQSLLDQHRFQVVFYNESPGSLDPGTSGGRLLNASETNKERAARFVQAISPQGGTEHIPGLKMGLSFGPDVLFFLTDAAEPAMSEAQLLEIQDRAERSLTTIHTIQFQRGEATNDGGWIRDLAEMNRGTYRYVDITTIE